MSDTSHPPSPEGAPPLNSLGIGHLFFNLSRMSHIIPNLWIGGIASISDTKRLKANNIQYVLSVMRGQVPMDPVRGVLFQNLSGCLKSFAQIGLIRYQVELDDTEYSDLLVHIPPCIAFLEKAMASGKGVIVHCQAGMSECSNH